MSLLPLVVDLDGTLIRTDMLHESALRILRDRPFDTLRIPYWLSHGKAVLKRHLALRAVFDPSSLPYNRDLLDWLKQQRTQGRTLILCTASDCSIASAIADHLGVFDGVMASDGILNLAGNHKAEALVQRFGHAGFDYAGNSNADLAVWQRARSAVLVNASKGLVKKAEACCEVERVFPSPTVGFTAWRRVLRVHQWLKNFLLFVPLFAAHQITNPDAWLALILAFFSFNLCASSVYIGNDLLDMGIDIYWPQIKLYENNVDFVRRSREERVTLLIHPDRQNLIPEGTPAQIDAAVRKYADTYHELGGGGIFYIEIENDAPWENVKTLIEAVHRYR